MSSRIIKIKPTENYFSIDWQVSIRCNYDCMYCSPEWHDNYSPHHNLETMQTVWKNIISKTQHLNLPYKVSFTGGELTTNKDFLPFVSWLRENYNQQLFKLMLTTNGSASYRYYFEMFKNIDNIAFSVHSEHIDEDKFFSKVIRLRNSIPVDKFIQVAIMDEFWNRDRIPYYIQLLEENNVSYTVNQINHTFQTRKIPIMKGKLNFEI